MNMFFKIKLNFFSPRFILFVFAVFLLHGCGGGSDSNVSNISPAVSGTNQSEPLEITPGTIVSTSVITDGSVSWEFSASVQTGKFANGDYWIVGPVTITAITPGFNGQKNGFEVNPVDTKLQGFDSRINSFTPSLVPSLPYDAVPGESIVKVVSVDASGCRPCIQSASVLTILSSAPPNNGANVFRPPYVGTDKPLYLVDDINLSLLPNYVGTNNAVSFDTVASQYRNVQLDHKTGWTVRYMHPVESMPDYGSDIARRNTEAALALMLNGTSVEKAQAVINYVNYGIDIYHMVKVGTRWPANGGHGEGRKLPAVMAAVLLESTEMKSYLSSVASSTFGETNGVYFSTLADMGNGKVLWGQINDSEKLYWDRLVLEKGSKTIKDPYGEIDGGVIRLVGVGGYQYCCTSIVWENIITALELMPSLKPIFNFPNLKVYTDRWMASGYHTQPDSCAPATGLCSGGTNAGAACTTANVTTQCTGTGATCDIASSYPADYKVTYGPDGSGGCIQDLDSSDGIGRFPQLHGTYAGTGYYGSAFAREMQKAYRPY